MPVVSSRPGMSQSDGGRPGRVASSMQGAGQPDREGRLRFGVPIDTGARDREEREPSSSGRNRAGEGVGRSHVVAPVVQRPNRRGGILHRLGHAARQLGIADQAGVDVRRP